MLLSLCVLLICVFTIPKLKENADVILISFLMIPGHIMFPDWFFQAMERMKYITILNLLSKTLFTIAVFLFIKEKQDYLLQPLFTSLGFVVSGMIAMYCILVKWEVKLYFTSFKTIFRTIKSSTNVFINNIAHNLYNAFSIRLFETNALNLLNKFFFISFFVLIVKHLLAPKVVICTPYFMVSAHAKHSL